MPDRRLDWRSEVRDKTRNMVSPPPAPQAEVPPNERPPPLKPLPQEFLHESRVDIVTLRQGHRIWRKDRAQAREYIRFHTL